jgi:hypothetical protein
MKKVVLVKNRLGSLAAYSLATDTEVISHAIIGRWLVEKIPVKPKIYATTPNLSNIRPAPSQRLIGNLDITTQASQYYDCLQKLEAEIDWEM